MPNDPDKLINQLVVTVAGLECVRDYLQEEILHLVPETLHGKKMDHLQAELAWRWNTEAYQRTRAVAARVGLETGAQIDELARLKEPLIEEKM